LGDALADLATAPLGALTRRPDALRDLGDLAACERDRAERGERLARLVDCDARGDDGRAELREVAYVARDQDGQHDPDDHPGEQCRVAREDGSTAREAGGREAHARLRTR